jgi:hypothetical protein
MSSRRCAELQQRRPGPRCEVDGVVGHTAERVQRGGRRAHAPAARSDAAKKLLEPPRISRRHSLPARCGPCMLGVAPICAVGKTRGHRAAPCSSALADISTPGTPAPGCVPAPTRYRPFTSSLRLCGRNQALCSSSGSMPKAAPLNDSSWSWKSCGVVTRELTMCCPARQHGAPAAARCAAIAQRRCAPSRCRCPGAAPATARRRRRSRPGATDGSVAVGRCRYRLKSSVSWWRSKMSCSRPS